MVEGGVYYEDVRDEWRELVIDQMPCCSSPKSGDQTPCCSIPNPCVAGGGGERPMAGPNSNMSSVAATGR